MANGFHLRVNPDFKNKPKKAKGWRELDLEKDKNWADQEAAIIRSERCRSGERWPICLDNCQDLILGGEMGSSYVHYCVKAKWRLFSQQESLIPDGSTGGPSDPQETAQCCSLRFIQNLILFTLFRHSITFSLVVNQHVLQYILRNLTNSDIHI